MALSKAQLRQALDMLAQYEYNKQLRARLNNTPIPYLTVEIAGKDEFRIIGATDTATQSNLRTFAANFLDNRLSSIRTALLAIGVDPEL